jgi:hypothetical protein
MGGHQKDSVAAAERNEPPFPDDRKGFFCIRNLRTLKALPENAGPLKRKTAFVPEPLDRSGKF